MNAYLVSFTPQAEKQLENIAHYIAVDLCDPDAAESLVDRVIEEADRLSRNPEKHRTIDEQPWGSQGIRKIHVKNYYVYFWIDKESTIVWIIGIVFTKRNQVEYLSSLRDAI